MPGPGRNQSFCVTSKKKGVPEWGVAMRHGANREASPEFAYAPTLLLGRERVDDIAQVQR